MPADYKGMGHGHEKKPVPGFVWLFAGLAIGLFVALLVYLDKQPAVTADFGAAVQKELEKIKHKTKTTTSQTETKTDKSADKEEPKFNFYTILPELEVLIPDSETQPPSKKPTSGSHDDNKQYILQAGSFKKQGDAEKLKASLALLGFEAHIQSVTVNGTAWHRVRVGPYNQSNDLYDKIDQLKQNKINAVAMELRTK